MDNLESDVPENAKKELPGRFLAPPGTHVRVAL